MIDEMLSSEELTCMKKNKKRRDASEDWIWDPLRSNVLMTCETYFTENGMHGMNLGSHYLLEIRECCSIVT